MAKKTEHFKNVADHIKDTYVEGFISELPNRELDILEKIENAFQCVRGKENRFDIIMSLMFSHITVQDLQNVKKNIDDFMDNAKASYLADNGDIEITKK